MRGARLRNGLTSLRLLGLCLGDVKWRQCTDLDPCTVVFDELGGERERVLRHLLGLDREDQIPIRVAHAGDRSDDRRAQLGLGYLLIDLRDLEQRPRGIRPEVPQQRLSEGSRQRRVEHRVARREEVRLFLPVVVEGDRVAAAAPLDVLRQAVVASECVGAEDVAACRLAARERRLAADAEVGDEVRAIGCIEGGKREVEGLRVQPLDREVEIAVERALDGGVERELDTRAGRWGRRGRAGLPVCFVHAGKTRFGEFLRCLASDVVEACRLRLGLRRGGRCIRARVTIVKKAHEFCMVLCKAC